MKTFLSFLLVLFLSVSVFAQDEEDDGAWRNPTMIKEHPLTKDVAYEIILMAMAEEMSNSDANVGIKFNDKELGKIVGAGIGTANNFLGMEICTWDYTLTVSIKDNKIRYAFISGLNSFGYEINWSIEGTVLDLYDELVTQFQDKLENYVDDGF